MWRVADLDRSLKRDNPNYTVQVFESIPSTLPVARQLATNGKLAMVIAKTQTNGVGRRDNRQFFSPVGGLYITWVMPNVQTITTGLITTRLAVYFTQVLQKYTDDNIVIKWVNDLYVQNKKIAGILVEQVENAFVIGFGLNMNLKAIPDELLAKITSIQVDEHYRLDIINALTQQLDKLNQIDDTWLRTYQNLSYVIGKNVQIKIGKATIQGRVKTIDQNGGLVLDTGQTIYAGEVIKVDVLGERI